MGCGEVSVYFWLASVLPVVKLLNPSGTIRLPTHVCAFGQAFPILQVRLSRIRLLMPGYPPQIRQGLAILVLE
jgi:hypothetical protein